MDAAPVRYRTAIGAASLIVGPSLMSAGDLLHPKESWDMAVQIAIVGDAPTRWYAAHLLLFVGLLLFVPGILSLTSVVAKRKPRTGYAARVLMIASVGALSGVFVSEMMLGRFISDGADQRSAIALLRTFQSLTIFGALVPGLLAFFIGIGLAVSALATPAGPFRLPALGFALGALCILGEIVLAIVLLSQIGNLLMLGAGIATARVLLRNPEAASG
jgi:hypothetical protein